MKAGYFVVLAVGLAGCAQGGFPRGSIVAFFDRLFHRAILPAPTPSVHYVVGAGYPAGGLWYYPREDFGYDSTGLATIQSGPHDPLTSDGEVFDPTAMAAAHQTLQLPAVVRVTNLANGRQVLLRLNDRGPASPARILEVTPRAAQLLGFAGEAARVRVQIESEASQAVAAELHGGGIAITAAPRAGVQADTLAPPPGVRASRPPRVASATAVAPAASPPVPVVPARLPEAVQQVAADPGSLWIEAGRFGVSQYAQHRAAQLAASGARVERVSSGGQTSYTVRIGPLDSVSQADATLLQVIRAGVIDGRIAVE